MAIGPVDALGAAANVVNPLGGAAGFANALGNALGGGGQDQQITDAIVQGGVQMMGQMMMRQAGEILNEAMADDEG
jgi:hypothetical protein